MGSCNYPTIVETGELLGQDRIGTPGNSCSAQDSDGRACGDLTIKMPAGRNGAAESQFYRIVRTGLGYVCRANRIAVF